MQHCSLLVEVEGFVLIWQCCGDLIAVAKVTQLSLWSFNNVLLGLTTP
jgi:hypothetical protein